MRDKIKENLSGLMLFLRREDLLNKLKGFVKEHKKISLAFIAIALIVVIMRVSIFSHVGTYVAPNNDTRITLKLNGTYTSDLADEGKGTYEISPYNVVLTPRDSDEQITYLREGKYLYNKYGWNGTASPYYVPMLEEGKRIEQTLSHVAHSTISTFLGTHVSTVKNELQLQKDGTYVYTFTTENSTKGNKISEEITKGTYKRKKNELILTREDGYKKTLIIVDGNLVYINAYKKR